MTFESRRNRFAAVMAIGQMVGSGPPLFRTRELLALIDAGLASFAGARPQVSVQSTDTGATWQLTSPTTGDTPLRSTTLIDAWMHSPDIRVPGDPLGQALMADGRVRASTTTPPMVWKPPPVPPRWIPAPACSSTPMAKQTHGYT